MAREAFKRTDKYIHLLGLNAETLKFIFEMDTIVPEGKDHLKERPGEPDLMGISALLTTIMPSIKATFKALTEAGLHDKVKVVVGRAPVTAKYSAEIGADRCTQDAADEDTAHEFLT